MKNFLFGLLATVLMLPAFTFAGNGIAGGDVQGGELGGFMSNVLDFITTIILPFILAIGFLVFVWGIFKYFILGGANDEAKESGRKISVEFEADVWGKLIICEFEKKMEVSSNFWNLSSYKP